MAKTGKHVVSLDSSARVIFVAFIFVKLPPLIAGSVPVRLAAGILPEPVILLPLRSKSPPS